MLLYLNPGGLTTEVIEKRDSSQNRCYSCASENLKPNFLTRTRGPHPRLKEPQIYDNMCDLDTWLIRERGNIKGYTDCSGLCFKWQQIFNNSGIFSYSTIRGCWGEMLDTKATIAQPQPSNLTSQSECNSNEVPLIDSRLDHSTIIESLCWCQGDFCNAAPGKSPNYVILLIVTITFTFLTFFHPR